MSQDLAILAILAISSQKNTKNVKVQVIFQVTTTTDVLY